MSKSEVKMSRECTDAVIGESIINFINGIETCDTEIGDYRDNKYVVTGIEFENASLSYPITVLVPIEKAIICTETKLANSHGRNIMNCVDAYCKLNNLSEAVTLKYKEQVKRFMSNKTMVMCVRPGSNVIVTQSEDGIKSRTAADVVRAKFAVDNKLNKLVSSLLAKGESKFENGKTVRLNIEDYGKTWVLPKIEQLYDSKMIDYDLIKMNNFGFIKPIVVKHNKIEVALDSNYLYGTMNGTTEIIGEWTNTGFEIFEHSESYETLIKRIFDHLAFISSHRKYIGPYLVSNPNIIEI